MNQAILTTMNWSGRSCWIVSKQQIVSAKVPNIYRHSNVNNISACCFYHSERTYKTAGTPVSTKRRCFDRNAVHQVISMNSSQRPMMSGSVNNILLGKMCNHSFFGAKYSNQCNNFLCRKNSFNWTFKNKNSGTVQHKTMIKFYSSGSNNQIQEATELSETPILHEESGKPIAPDPETCCETGCVHCVWIKYVEELLNYYPDGIQEEEVKDILKKIHDPLVRSFVKMELGA